MAWSRRSSGARSCSSATTATSGSSGSSPTPATWPTCPSTYPSPTRGGEIGLDRAGRIRVPAGAALDLGATGKAFAADLVATAVERELGVPAVVSLGGDVRVAVPDGRPWSVAVSEHPGTAPATTVWLDRGGLATSCTQVRRWSRAGVDPAPPARPAHRSAGARGVAHRHRHRPDLRGRQHRQHRGRRPRARTRRPGWPHTPSPPGSSRPTGGPTTSAAGPPTPTREAS